LLIAIYTAWQKYLAGGKNLLLDAKYQSASSYVRSQ